MNNSQSTLIRGFTIIEKIAQADRALSSAYLAEELELPKATVHRIAQQLENEGFLQREAGGKRFTASQRLKHLAINTLSNSAINAHRSAILKELSAQTNETCNLTILDGHEIVYLERVESNWPYRIHLPVGSHLPLHCTAAGKLFLAYMKPSLRTKLINSIDLKRYTDTTITDPQALEQQLEKIAREGVGFDTGEYLDGMVALSIPVIGSDHQLCFAIAIHAPSVRKSLDELRQYLPALRHAAAQISAMECAEEESSTTANESI